MYAEISKLPQLLEKIGNSSIFGPGGMHCRPIIVIELLSEIRFQVTGTAIPE